MSLEIQVNQIKRVFRNTYALRMANYVVMKLQSEKMLVIVQCENFRSIFEFDSFIDNPDIFEAFLSVNAFKTFIKMLPANAVIIEVKVVEEDYQNFIAVTTDKNKFKIALTSLESGNYEVDQDDISYEDFNYIEDLIVSRSKFPRPDTGDMEHRFFLFSCSGRTYAIALVKRIVVFVREVPFKINKNLSFPIEYLYGLDFKTLKVGFDSESIYLKDSRQLRYGYVSHEIVVEGQFEDRIMALIESMSGTEDYVFDVDTLQKHLSLAASSFEIKTVSIENGFLYGENPKTGSFSIPFMPDGNDMKFSVNSKIFKKAVSGLTNPRLGYFNFKLDNVEMESQVPFIRGDETRIVVLPTLKRVYPEDDIQEKASPSYWISDHFVNLNKDIKYILFDRNQEQCEHHYKNGKVTVRIFNPIVEMPEDTYIFDCEDIADVFKIHREKAIYKFSVGGLSLSFIENGSLIEYFLVKSYAKIKSPVTTPFEGVVTLQEDMDKLLLSGFNGDVLIKGSGQIQYQNPYFLVIGQVNNCWDEKPTFKVPMEMLYSIFKWKQYSPIIEIYPEWIGLRPICNGYEYAYYPRMDGEFKNTNYKEWQFSVVRQSLEDVLSLFSPTSCLYKKIEYGEIIYGHMGTRIVSYEIGSDTPETKNLSMIPIEEEIIPRSCMINPESLRTMYELCRATKSQLVHISIHEDEAVRFVFDSPSMIAIVPAMVPVIESINTLEREKKHQLATSPDVEKITKEVITRLKAFLPVLDDSEKREMIEFYIEQIEESDSQELFVEDFLITLNSKEKTAVKFDFD